MKSIKIFTSQAIPGMIVAENIFTQDNHLIISEDTKLTDKIITRLEFYSIFDISVYSDTDISDAEPELVKNTYYDEIRKSEAFQRFHLAYMNAVAEFKNTFDHIVSEQEEIDTDKLLSDVSKILYECNSNIE
jgi:hypothetical protein